MTIINSASDDVNYTYDQGLLLLNSIAVGICTSVMCTMRASMGGGGGGDEATATIGAYRIVGNFEGSNFPSFRG